MPDAVDIGHDLELFVDGLKDDVDFVVPDGGLDSEYVDNLIDFLLDIEAAVVQDELPRVQRTDVQEIVDLVQQDLAEVDRRLDHLLVHHDCFLGGHFWRHFLQHRDGAEHGGSQVMHQLLNHQILVLIDILKLLRLALPELLLALHDQVPDDARLQHDLHAADVGNLVALHAELDDESSPQFLSLVIQLFCDIERGFVLEVAVEVHDLHVLGA